MEEATHSANPLKATFNILFVCTGNTCRSPLAAALARHELAQRGWQHVEIASAGIAAQNGEPASEFAVEAGHRRGLQLADHRSRALSPELLDWADLVLGMSPSHLWALERLGAGEKTSLLGDFAAGLEGAGEPVSDPYGGDAAAYEETAIELERLVRASLDRLAPILSP